MMYAFPECGSLSIAARLLTGKEGKKRFYSRRKERLPFVKDIHSFVSLKLLT